MTTKTNDGFLLEAYMEDEKLFSEQYVRTSCDWFEINKVDLASENHKQNDKHVL